MTDDELTLTPEQEDEIMNEIETDDALAELPPERLAAMLRDKRKAEASLRTRLREAEAQRDKHAATIANYQRDSLQALAKDRGVQPSALADLDSHLKAAELLADDGTLDTAKAEAALTTLRQDKAYLFNRASRSGTSFDGAGQGHYSDPGASWSGILNNS